jgi:hypothetical protein
MAKLERSFGKVLLSKPTGSNAVPEGGLLGRSNDAGLLTRILDKRNQETVICLK